MASAEAESLVLGILEARAKASRLRHSLSVAETAETLCARFGLDPRRGRLAGLSHDIAKDRALAEQWELARRAGGHPGTADLAPLVESLAGTQFADKVVHGPAGAVLLFEAGISADAELLGAVAYHSTARPGMSPLEKLIFAADKLEPGRKGAGQAEAKALRSLGLDELFRWALGRSIAFLSAEGGAIAQTTLDLYNALGSAGT